MNPVIFRTTRRIEFADTYDVRTDITARFGS